MKKTIKPSDNNANQQNANKGAPGNNKQFDKAQGNRGKQLNPNYPGGKRGNAGKGGKNR